VRSAGDRPEDRTTWIETSFLATPPVSVTTAVPVVLPTPTNAVGDEMPGVLTGWTGSTTLLLEVRRGVLPVPGGQAGVNTTLSPTFTTADGVTVSVWAPAGAASAAATTTIALARVHLMEPSCRRTSYAAAAAERTREFL
jgi:hypothetical protein